MMTGLVKLTRGLRLIPIMNPTNCASNGQSKALVIFLFPLIKADFPCHPIPLNKAIHLSARLQETVAQIRFFLLICDSNLFVFL